MQARNYWIRTVLAVIAMTLVIPALSIAQTSTDEKLAELTAELQAAFETIYQQEGFPGATVAFVLADGTEGAVAVGYSDKELEIPMTTDDRLLSGSIGKTYFAAVAMQLVAENKLDLDAKISTWLGEESWFSRLPNGKDITVRMLMNHSSGIPEHVAIPEFSKAAGEDPDRVWKHEELMEYILDSKPPFEAGKGWSYADTNYIVLGIILEKITGTALYDELQQRVLTPLGLKDTVPSDSRTIPGLVPGYSGNFNPFGKPGKTIIEGKFVVNPQLEWTGGGLASTTMDLARWGWAVYQGKAFPLNLMDQVLDGLPAQTGPNDRYGLGVIMWDSKYGRCLGHSGWFPGYLSHMAYYADLKICLAIQINTDMLRGANMKMRKILDDFAGILSK